jgi:hypothetical protein
MHDGSLVTLRDVVDYYNRGGNSNPGLDTDLRPLKTHRTGDERVDGVSGNAQRKQISELDCSGNGAVIARQSRRTT